MKKWISHLVILSVLLTLVVPAQLHAGSTEIMRVQSVMDVLNAIMGIPEGGIPPRLLGDAFGIAIIPGVIKAGFFVGGRYGKGVLVVRNEGAGWSNPLFISLMGGSFGYQFGGQSTDIILVFKSNRSIETITGGKFTIGADASAAAGPVGRHAEAATDIQLRSEILSYSRSRGLFAGVALEGAAIQIDQPATSAFYNMAGLLPIQVLKSQDLQTPPIAADLRNLLNRYATQ